tara:strand:- start:348 stop:773 length:426 start_codon:yes stop_codon:yes gene_type:complete
MEIYFRVLKENYVNFCGRVRRKEFWMFHLFVAIFTLLCIILDNILGTVFVIDLGTLGTVFEIDLGTAGLISIPVGWLFFLCSIFHFLPSLSLVVRRLHDVGKSGSWYLIGLIPIIGGVFLIVFLCSEGDKNENKWGLNPKG